MTAKPKRRRFRYSLRSLLVFVTMASAGFGWLGVKVRQAQRQKELVAVAGRMGAYVLYDNGEAFPSSPPSLIWSERLLGDHFFATVTEVNFATALPGLNPLREQEIALLGELSDLRRLDFAYMPVNDEGFAHLERLTRLEYLSAGYSQVSDAGLAHLAGLVRLKYLVLYGPHITDAGLLQLQRLKQLECLHLRDTRVTDVGLEHLQKLAQLEQLNLFGTLVTDEGCRKLQETLPTLKIIR